MPNATSFESFEKELRRLVEIFGKNLTAYKSPGYDEANVRKEFLDPFFRELGWDIENKAGLIPSHREVIVEHQYRPSVGISSDIILRRILRSNKALSSEVEGYRKDYCISDAFLAQLDARAGNGEINEPMIGEQRINYVLKSGADWAGPIGSFKLTIDPGASDRLVSFCPGQLKPTAPNALEFTAEDFTPEGNLKILIIGRF